MTRVLKRPMFRLGGPANEGITSGLAPRQGYRNSGLADIPFEEWEKGKLTPREMYEAAGDIVRPTGKSGDLSQFMIDFGLDIASATPSGSIFSTAAQSAKEPFARYQKTKAERGQTTAESQADLFGELFKGAIGEDERSFAHRDKAAMIGENMDKQNQKYADLAALDKNDPDYESERAGIMNDIRKLKEQINSPELSKAMMTWLKSGNNLRTLETMVKNQVAEELGISPDTDFTEGEVGKNFYNIYTQRINKIISDLGLGIAPTFATGGRVGYQAAGSVMGDAIQADQAMPEELGDISYEELRSRLPQEVSDEIVRLLANSAEALEDFATIQTEQDIANFNKKYGVNLVLPAEG